MKCTQFLLIFLIGCLCNFTIINAQPSSSIDLSGKKPGKYSERILLSEKSDKTKFRRIKRFFQNTFTHYNYFFNANVKINEVLERAKALNKDDYTQLLPFYNYSFENTAKESIQTDSIIYKCTAAILLHDLRDDWVDNMYILMGRTYLLRKNFDSAAFVFQYINYAWSTKDDGYDLPIGSNITSANGLFTISTAEKKSRIRRLLIENPPSRNEAFIWKIRTLLEQDKIGEANGIIALLRVDTLFPKRLKPSLHEMLAYANYKQQIWDSAAYHLEKALPNAEDRFEKARWEYLIGQMLQKGKQKDSVTASFFEKSIKHTTDPLMEVFARLNLVSLSSKKKGFTLKDNTAELYHLARKDRFSTYRDVMYYAAAILELQQKNEKAAVKALQKSLKYANDNPTQKQKSFLLLADTYFDNGDYTLSSNYYDSINTAGLTDIEKLRVEDRKSALKTITTNINTIQSEDSLQRIARMPEADRKLFIKKLLKQLRKAEGIKEGDALDFGIGGDLAGSSTLPTTLFSNDANGQFYFNNPALVQTGARDFKTKWGNRPNNDNWRRQEAISKPTVKQQPKQTQPIDDIGPDMSPSDMQMSLGNDIDQPPKPIVRGKNGLPIKGADTEGKPEKDLTFEGLMRDVPLLQEQLYKSDSAIAKALFSNGVAFQNNLRDYTNAVANYESLINRYPLHQKVEEANFNLIYCYRQLGLTQRADSLTKALKTNYPKSLFWARLENNLNKDVQSDTTKDYQKVYNTFIEGQFETAKQGKIDADKKYGHSYWTPQLLYIESVYYITLHMDSTAVSRLQDLADAFPTTPLAEKALRMIELLKSRHAIEDHLTYYTEPRHADTAEVYVPSTIYKTDSSNNANKPKKSSEIKTTLQALINSLKADTTALGNTNFVFDPNEPHYAVMQLDNVDRVFINEVGNSFSIHNKEKFYNETIEIASEKIDNQYSFVYFGPFGSAQAAVNYVDKVKPFVSRTIVPWLPASKYKFSIIGFSNLILLQQNQKVALYNQFIKKIFPDKF